MPADDQQAKQKAPRFTHQADFAGGRLHFGLRRTGPRTFRASGIFVHHGLPLKPQFQADVTLGVKVDAPSGMIGKTADVVRAVMGLFSLPGQEGTDGEGS